MNVKHSELSALHEKLSNKSRAWESERVRLEVLASAAATEVQAARMDAEDTRSASRPCRSRDSPVSHSSCCLGALEGATKNIGRLESEAEEEAAKLRDACVRADAMVDECGTRGRSTSTVLSTCLEGENRLPGGCVVYM